MKQEYMTRANDIIKEIKEYQSLQKELEDQKETLKEFMKDYNGFNWENGKLIIVTKDGNPTIISGCYKAILKKHLNDFVWDWTHDKDTIVITLYR